ncbi:radical SAM family heme chaperone HemW [Marinicellulosiphila megalodicopiae]|uniref:radical SAM family heme chaperone HemW n=1 Tax=Marinicellulosiphila megalodicopiae TaxID=2724896 RepID=UPI003BAFEE6A
MDTNQALPINVPLSLYVHLPWCVKKCPYCDFNSHTFDEIPEAQYLEQLKKDFISQKPSIQNRPLQSIFFGGGTPSLMSGQFYTDLIVFLKNNIEFKSDIEITLEANPGTFEKEKFADFYRAGINRLSLGVQSFQDSFLKDLGRIHNSDDAINAIEHAKKIGFSNFNIDLMYGLPNQSIDDALFDLKQAVQLNSTHLSWYQLTIEPNTEFYKTQPVLPIDDALFDIQQQGQAFIKESGFDQYEISAYAKNNLVSKHNMNYWQFGDYIGIGAGAHGKVTLNKTINRTRRTRQPSNYLNQPLQLINEPVATDELLFECLMNGFRLKQGISWLQIKNNSFLNKEDVINRLQKFIDQSLVLHNNQSIWLSEKGYLFLDGILEELV